jgi:hypothetical protein
VLPNSQQPRMRYPLAFMVRTEDSPRNRQRGRGVELGREDIARDGAEPRPLRDIVRIRLLPFDGGDDPDWGRCELAFTDGARLVVTSLGERGAPTPECDSAYGAFLRELHARLDSADRARIVFEDGVGFGIGQALVLIVFAAPLAMLALQAQQPWLRLAGLLLPVVLAGILAWTLVRHRDPKRYAPERLPERALPPAQRRM